MQKAVDEVVAQLESTSQAVGGAVEALTSVDLADDDTFGDCPEIVFVRQDNVEEAMQWWLKMRPRDGDTYGDAATAILRILGPGKVDVAALRSVLWKESARWHDVNYGRLKQFG